MVDNLALHVPATVADMLPPKQSSLIAEAASFLRAHWDDVKEDYQVISGELPTVHGSGVLDEAACVFKIKKLAADNGYAFLGNVQTDKLRKALRFGYKRNTGTSMRLLEKQGRQLRIAHRRQEQQQRNAA